MTKSQVSKHPYLTGNALIKVFAEADITIQNMWSEEDSTSLESSGVTNLTKDTATTTTTTTMKPSISSSSDEGTQSTVPELRNLWRSTLYPPSTIKVVLKALGNNTPVQAEDDGIYKIRRLGLGIPEHTELPEYMQVSKRSPAKRQLIKEYTNEN